MRFIILFVIMVLLFFGVINVDLQKITPWLLGINFTIAIFSINFTFFGYQLSKYKAIYSKINNRQWFNIVILLSLPFLPLICFLIIPAYFEKIAFLILPILAFSSVDNALLTAKYLSPNKLIKDSTNDSAISQYIKRLANIMIIEVEVHQSYLDEGKKYKLPMHAFNFEPGTLGLEPIDIWDSMSVITKLSIENNDYPVFRQSLSAILKLVLKFYTFEADGDNSYKIEDGIKFIARKRLQSIITTVIEEDKGGMFFQSLSSELCNFLMQDEVLQKPCSPMARAVCSDAVWIGKKMLETHSVIEPTKILNTIHRIAECSIYSMENTPVVNKYDSLDKYNISVYAYDIKDIGVSALNSGNSHFAYRCMESLSYLGCNSAKVKSMQTIVAVLESIVHLGRLARNLKIGCFWDRCLIPAESHAEEFIGHILTWLVRDLNSDGNFYMKDYAEQAYSRIRGVKCSIKPKPNSNPCCWIIEIVDNGKKVPHIEYEAGMYGYCGESDYSDFSNLKEYVLYGFGSGSSADIIHSPPIPIKFESESSKNFDEESA